MTKKRLHIILATFLMLVIAFTVGKSAFGNDASPTQSHLVDSEDPMPEAEFLSVQAMVPVLSFKLGAALIFVFEIFAAEPNTDFPSVDRLIGLIDSYRQNLFTSAIIVNAP